jgi:hypothetical protein
MRGAKSRLRLRPFELGRKFLRLKVLEYARDIFRIIEIVDRAHNQKSRLVSYFCNDSDPQGRESPWKQLADLLHFLKIRSSAENITGFIDADENSGQFHSHPNEIVKKFF